MTKKEIAQRYIHLLEAGDRQGITDLFSESGEVISPLYGVKTAERFYDDLAVDTLRSELKIKGIFEEGGGNRLALYFDYIWTLKTGKKVSFEVVDILEFDKDNKLDKLTIIYDTVDSRSLLKEEE